MKNEIEAIAREDAKEIAFQIAKWHNRGDGAVALFMMTRMVLARTKGLPPHVVEVLERLRTVLEKELVIENRN